ASTASPSARMYYLDALRVVLTILVIATNVGQAYGPTGGYWPVQSPTRAAVLGPSLPPGDNRPGPAGEVARGQPCPWSSCGAHCCARRPW
ncbi:MAG TPA: hypothetical protein VL359_11955, partial [bacterium]|nr:hypothetical protein [bacterium]